MVPEIHCEIHISFMHSDAGNMRMPYDDVCTTYPLLSSARSSLPTSSVSSVAKLSWLVSTHSSMRRLTVCECMVTGALQTTLDQVGRRTFVIVDVILPFLCICVLSPFDDASEVVLPIAPLALDAAVDLQGLLCGQAVVGMAATGARAMCARWGCACLMALHQLRRGLQGPRLQRQP